MKYKVLITGKNPSVMDDFFLQMADDFDILSSSTRYMDLSQHINYFHPDVFVYCSNREAQNSFTHGLSIKLRLSELKIPFVLIGSRNDCEEFIRSAPNAPDLILYRPLSANAIQEKITRFLDERAQEEAAEETIQNIQQEDPIPAELLDELELEPEPEIPQRKHILVVDDDPMMLKMIKEHLHEDYDIATAVNGNIAMKFLERRMTDLILLDYEMPEENGPAILEKLRAKESTKDIPVIFLTGVTEREKIQEALVLRPQGYLLKPIDREKLLETINKNIG